MENFIHILELVAAGFTGSFITNWFSNRDKKKTQRILLLEDKLHKIYAPLLINISLLYTDTCTWRKSQKTDQEKVEKTKPFVEELRNTAITACIQNMLLLRNKILDLLSNNFGFLDKSDEEIFLSYIQNSEKMRPICFKNTYIALVDAEHESDKHPIQEEEDLLKELQEQLKMTISQIKKEIERIRN